MDRDRLPILIVVAALLAAMLAGAALVAPTDAQDPDATADRHVSVDATGTADAAPDRAVVRVAATVTGDDPAAVRDDLAANADALRGELEAAGLDADQYETEGYRIDERNDERADTPEVAGYRGVHGFVVTLDDPQAAGAVIDAAANASAEVRTVRFTLSEERRTELRQDAIETAMEDARSQADAIAANGDLAVTSVHSVDATQQDYRPVEYQAAAPRAADASGSTSVETGDVTVSYRVRVTYNATRA